MSGNLREKIAKCRKMLEKTFRRVMNFFEIFGNHRKSSDVFRNHRKISEIVSKCLKQHFLPTIFENFRKTLVIFRSVRKCSETFTKIFYNIPISDTCIQEFWFVICTGITLFALVLHSLHWCYSSTALLSANENRVMFSFLKEFISKCLNTVDKDNFNYSFIHY